MTTFGDHLRLSDVSAANVLHKNFIYTMESS